MLTCTRFYGCSFTAGIGTISSRSLCMRRMWIEGAGTISTQLCTGAALYIQTVVVFYIAAQISILLQICYGFTHMLHEYPESYKYFESANFINMFFSLFYCTNNLQDKCLLMKFTPTQVVGKFRFWRTFHTLHLLFSKSIEITIDLLNYNNRRIEL